MKKIILIEDRYKRQELFVKELDFEFENYENILDNVILDDFYHLANEIIHNSFSLSQYDIIICHKSVQIEDKNDSNGIIINRLREYCKVHQKTLIFFSGGISINFYDNSEFELLELNSKTFYSKNLSLFLDAFRNQNEDILMLCYGEHWKENIVANTLEKTNIFLFDVEHYQASLNEFQIDDNLSKIDYEFYKLEEKSINEIEKFKQSLELYFTFENVKDTKKESLVIHHDNICSIELFDKIEKFNASENIDKYISEMIIDLKEKDFEVLFIKDNLSSNYLELLGLRVAYHIRLSSELGNKRFVPIIIISDFNIEQLCKFDEIANILFTPNVYLCKNTKEDVEKYQQLEFEDLSVKEFIEEFLSKIKINPPKDYLSHHGIANEWAIYRWSEFLKVQSEAINANKSKIEDMLYFKYLKAKYPIPKKTGLSLVPKSPLAQGNILYIDDEWQKGWSDIFEKYFSKSENIKLTIPEFQYKDASYEMIQEMVKEQLNSVSFDLILLDMRLIKDDHEQQNEHQLSGMKLLSFIKSYNQGIQIILLTASEKSKILEEANKHNILGYIRKESPKDDSNYTKEIFKKLTNFVDIGLEKKYFKDIWNIQQNILKLNILNQERYNQIRIEVESVFEILQSDMSNKFIYSMLSIFKTIEIIIGFYIEERFEGKNRFAYWIGTNQKISIVKKDEYFPKDIKLDDKNDSTLNKIRVILYEKLNLIEKEIHNDLINLVEIRNNTIHPGENINILNLDKNLILLWFENLLIILKKVDLNIK